MEFRRWLTTACSGTESNHRLDGWCGRLREALPHPDDNESGSVWRDLTLDLGVSSHSLVPDVISIPHATDDSVVSDFPIHLDDDADSLVGLEILGEEVDEPRSPPVRGRPTERFFPSHHQWPCHLTSMRTNTQHECAWTYSTASSGGHDDDLADFLKTDDGSSYSSAYAGALGKPPMPPVQRWRGSGHKKSASSGTAATTASTASRSSSK